MSKRELLAWGILFALFDPGISENEISWMMRREMSDRLMAYAMNG